MKYPPVQYHNYLKLNSLLSSQTRRSEELGNPAHEEMLFIIVHQAYELWFKQVLFELDSILEVFQKDQIAEKMMGRAVDRLDRILKIVTHTIGQIDLMETMTPLDFLDFRDYLYPASGFQSFQWRLIETKLGLKIDQRLTYNDSPFWKSLTEDQQTEMQKVLKQPSLFDRLESWLERTPFLKDKNFNFWQAYENALIEMLDADIEVIEKNPRLSLNEREKTLANVKLMREQFKTLFAPEKYADLQSSGGVRFSAKALQAALFILVYRDEPVLQIPHKLLSTLVDLDEKMTEWRYRHTLMAQRMLGKKIGTGGSSGHDYLKATTEKHKIFSDLVNLASFLLPRSRVPELPVELSRQMNYVFNEG